MNTDIEEHISNTEPIRRYWFDNDPFKTTCANSLSVPVPEAERFVIRTAQEALPQISDSNLREAVDILLHEEDAHSQVHDGYNALIIAQGYRIAPFVSFSEKLYQFLNTHADLKTRLAVCLSAEYLTALTGQHILTSNPFHDTDTDSRMRRLWIWHCLEELDHRGTVYDIYLHLGGGYIRRTALMLLMSVIYFASHALCLMNLLQQVEKMEGKKPKDADGFLYGKNGFYRSIFRDWFRFFAFGFHPTEDVHIPEGMEGTLRHYHVEEDIVRSLKIPL